MTWQDFSAVLRRFPVQDREAIERAFRLGAQMHSGQQRKSGEPYFSHPVAVARILIDFWADRDTVIAALLHDTVEDTPITLEEIERQFGTTVRNLIEGVTKLSREEMGEKPTLNEQIETLRKIFSLMQEDVRIMVIKLADRLHNMRTVQFLPPEKQEALARETLDVYVRIADRLCMFDTAQELEAFCIQTLEPEIFSKLSHLKEESERHTEEVVREMQRELQQGYPDVIRHIEAVPEQKSWRRLRQQMENEGAVATGVSAITVVFVCPDIDTCYRILGELHQLWKRETLSFQDFINSPQLNGYRGLHTTVIQSDGTRIRCKIRTQDMHRYAQQGITMLCFNHSTRPSSGTERGILKFLPWAQRISPLAEDTKDRSQEFWDSLQSDILGESIVIHGPSDETVHLPVGATALDGAFYLFKDLALRTASIKVNGREVSFQARLKHGDSLDVTLSDVPTVQREWLQWTKTGVATACIRSALSAAQSDIDKAVTGKAMLQRVFNEHRRGLIEEFHESQTLQGLHRLGHMTLDQAYHDIADGRLDPLELYESIFERQEKTQPEKPRTRILRYKTDMSNMDTMDRLNAVHRRHGHHLLEIRYQRMASNTEGGVFIRCRITTQELTIFLKELSAAGAEDIQTQTAFTRTQYVGAVTLLIMLWGLDPVVSRLLVTTTFRPFDLTFLRFATIFLASLVGYAFHTVISSHRLKPLSPLQPSLILAGIALFITGLLTYHTLMLISATQYILFILLGQIITDLAKRYLTRALQPRSFIPLFFVMVALTFLVNVEGFSVGGILFGLASSLSFSLYSQVSEQYQHAMIRTRYPAYLFWVSIISLLCAFLLLPFQAFTPPSQRDLLIAIVFSLLFTFVPYILYFESMRRLGRGTLDRLLPLTCLATFAGDLLLQQPFTVMQFVVLGLILFTLQSIASQRQTV